MWLLVSPLKESMGMCRDIYIYIYTQKRLRVYCGVFLKKSGDPRDAREI